MSARTCRGTRRTIFSGMWAWQEGSGGKGAEDGKAASHRVPSVACILWGLNDRNCCQMHANCQQSSAPKWLCGMASVRAAGGEGRAPHSATLEITESAPRGTRANAVPGLLGVKRVLFAPYTATSKTP